eukprot:1365851-Rhodomonas_salina.2
MGHTVAAQRIRCWWLPDRIYNQLETTAQAPAARVKHSKHDLPLMNRLARISADRNSGLRNLRQAGRSAASNRHCGNPIASVARDGSRLLSQGSHQEGWRQVLYKIVGSLLDSARFRLDLAKFRCENSKQFKTDQSYRAMTVPLSCETPVF